MYCIYNDIKMKYLCVYIMIDKMYTEYQCNRKLLNTEEDKILNSYIIY